MFDLLEERAEAERNREHSRWFVTELGMRLAVDRIWSTRGKDEDIKLS